MNSVFNYCVTFLEWLASLTGLTYQAVNVLIFCVVWPVFTLMLVGIVFHQRKTIIKLKAERFIPNAKA